MTGRPPVSPALHDAKLRVITAKAVKTERDGELSRIAVQRAEIELLRAEEKRAQDLTENAHHRVYLFDDPVNEGSVKKCIKQLNTWSRLDPRAPVEIIVDSPGGSIVAGFHLVDYIRDLRKGGPEITMTAYGMAASMAGVLMQAADTRVIGKHAFLLIHEGSLGAIGDFGDVEDRVELMGLMHGHIVDLFVERAKPINRKTTKSFIRTNWKRKDWWLTAKKAKEYGFVDSIR